MRTFEELEQASNEAATLNDHQMLHLCADDLEALGLPEANACAAHSRGLAESLRDNYLASLEHYHLALALYEELGDRAGVARDTGSIGIVYTKMGNYPAALKHYNRALALHEELSNRSGVADVNANIGTYHSKTGNYPAAFEYYHRALAVHEELGNLAGVAMITGNIGYLYSATSDYPLALEYLHRTLAILEKLGIHPGVANVTAGIGAQHVQTGNYPLALEYCHRALALYEALGARSGVASVTGNIGLLYQRVGNYPLALEHYHRALALYEALGARAGVAQEMSKICDALIATEQFVEAEALLHVMDSMQIENPVVLIAREEHRAGIQEHSLDFHAAQATLFAALELAGEHDLRSRQASIHKALRDISRKANDFEGYIKHNNEFTRITEEINGKEATLKMAMQEKQREIDAREKDHAKHMAVLHSTLPKHIADRVVRGEVVNDTFDNAAVLFLDVVGFTTHSSELDASVVVNLLQDIFTAYDAICSEHNVVKIKTIGDSYMAVAFPSDAHIANLAAVAIAMQASVFVWPHTGEHVQFRIGLHCGPVVAGVLGKERMQYDVWGDTVNVASRMESTSEPGRIHVSEQFANSLAPGTWNLEREAWNLEPRGTLDVKGKGMMQTYWLESTQ